MTFVPPPLHGEEMREKLKGPKPKTLKEVPGYLFRVIGGTISRLFYIIRLIWEANKSLLFLNAFMTLYNGLMPLVGTLITAHLLAEVVRSFSQDVNLFLPLALQFGYLFLNSLVSSLNGIVTRISGEIVTNHIKLKIMSKAREIDLASFDMPDFYERLENASREADMRPVSILSSTFEMISRVISMISYIVVLVSLLHRLEWTATVFFILFVAVSVLSAVLSFYFRRQKFMYMRHRSKSRRQMSYYSDMLVDKDSVKEIRLFGLADLFMKRYKDIFNKYFRGIKSLIWKEGGWNMALSLCSAVLNAILFFLVATHVRQIDDYSVYTGALMAISTCVTALITALSTVYEGSLFIDNLILFMKEEPHIVACLPEPRHPERHIGHTIEFRDVSFSYPGCDRPVLRHINLTLKAGTTAVLVGLNGAGKTTLIKLLTRLYDPTEGIVLLDGYDIREYDVAELYNIYGIIFQDFGKYAVSAGENIAFGQVDRMNDPSAVHLAAVQSGADAFIERLPRKYDTPLMRFFESDAVDLSVGQWQKLSVSRAFYADADILILDEPTASLDAIAEQEIYNQFDRLRKNKTTIFVSHRLSSATTADVVIVLRNGEIVEQGTHADLMAQKGDYYTLFSAQAKRYMTDKSFSN